MTMEELLGQIISSSQQGEEPPVELPESLQRHPWTFRSKDSRLVKDVNPKMEEAHKYFEENGPELARLFNLAYNPATENEALFFDTGLNPAHEMRVIAQRGGKGRFAYTTPFSRTIMLPGNDMAIMGQDNANALLAHEVLHSMGLPELPATDENKHIQHPHSSADIGAIIRKYMKSKKPKE